MKLTNRLPIFGWFMSLAFLAGCGVFSYLLWRDGAGNIAVYGADRPGTYPPWLMPLLLAAFWLVGLGVLGHLAATPCVRAEVLADRSLRLHLRYLWRSRALHLSAAELTAAFLVQEESGDGPYFYVRLVLANGSEVNLAEGSERARCAAICDEFNAAMGLTVDVD